MRTVEKMAEAAEAAEQTKATSVAPKATVMVRTGSVGASWVVKAWLRRTTANGGG